MRKLVHHLTIALAFTCALSILAIGCSSDKPAPTQPGSPDPPAGVDAPGTLTLPAGSTVSPDAYDVLTALAQRNIAVDGTFTARVGGDGPSIVWSVDSSGRAGLVGLVNPTDPAGAEISARTTAEVLLYWALGVQLFSPELQMTVLDLIRKDPATTTLAAVVASTFVDDVLTMNDEASPVISAVAAAVSTITTSGRLRIANENLALPDEGTIDIVPAGPQGGFGVEGDEIAQSLQLMNRSRRNGWYYLYKIRTANELGEYDLLTPEHIDDDPLPSVTRFNGNDPGDLGSFYTDFDWDIENLQDPIPLELEEGESGATYELIIAGGHMPDETALPAWYNANTNPDKGKWVQKAAAMPSYAVVKDILLQSIFSVTAPIGSIFPVNLTAEEAATFIFSMDLYVDGLIDDVNSGDWYRAMFNLLNTIDTTPEARVQMENQLDEWLPQLYAGDWLIGLWSALDGAGVYVDALGRGIRDVDVGGVLSANRNVERMERWEITVTDSPLSFGAAANVLDPDFRWTILTARIRGMGVPLCIRYTITDGLGCLLPFDGLDTECNGSLVMQVAGEERQIVYAVDDADLLEGNTATITAELFNVDCESIDASEPIATKSVVISHTRMVTIWCSNQFNILPWQTGANGVNLKASGSYGLPVTASVSFPGTERRDVSIYIPRGQPFGRDDLTVHGDYLTVNVFPESAILAYNDNAAGPILVPFGAHVRITNVLGSVTVVLPTAALPSPCGNFCCPGWANLGSGLQLIGAFVGAQVTGVGRTVVLIHSE